MIKKNIKDIYESELLHLIDNQIIEKKTLDYKRSLPGGSDSEKKGFLADVSSFANASGGDLIFGISQDNITGIPQAPLEGLEIKNVDQEILRLEQIIRDGIEPNIPSSLITTQPVPLSNSKTVLIIRIFKSWLGPHRVTFQSWDRFYSRSTNGKYRLDITELRAAFILSETRTERIRKFIENRISNLMANETPIPIFEDAKIVLHFIPVDSFNPAQRFDIEQLVQNSYSKLKPLFAAGYRGKYNLDGYITYSKFEVEPKAYSYLQIFRNGIIEVVDTYLLRIRNEAEKPLIYLNEIENRLINFYPNYIEIFQKLSIPPPIFVFLNLLRVRGYIAKVSQIPFPFDRIYPIDRDLLLLPEVIIEDYTIEATKILRPCFDSMWNACGFPKSINFDKNGEYKPAI